KSGVPISALPRTDVLAISHNHYDHLDERALARLPGKSHMTVVVPLRLGSFFRERGFPNVIELDWHERHEVRGVSITALPVVHWSRRTGFDTNRTLWAGFAVKSRSEERRVGKEGRYGRAPYRARAD